MTKKIWILFPCLCIGLIHAQDENPPSSDRAITSLYHTLDPLSIVQHLAFYELYPYTKEGRLALNHGWKLLCGSHTEAPSFILPRFDLSTILSLVTKQPSDPPVLLSEEQLETIQKISSDLSNRKLKGYSAWSEKELLSLLPEEIDLARALLIYQFEKNSDAKTHILQYEATLDLMALQIRVRLHDKASNEEKIKQINRFIFQEMGFRFPPQSLHAKDIDLYTFLPSVIDNRLGVCLGVSILYLCLAQRLDLPLDIITPPGHIYLSYKSEKGIINIETTARGIHMPSEVYLGVNTRSLDTKNIKEVIGLAFINQASVSWGRLNYATTVELYEKARLYLPNYIPLKMFLGMNYLFTGRKKEGKALFSEIPYAPYDDAVSPETIPFDFLKGNVDIEGLKTVFLSVDETRSSILNKQEALLKIVKKYPKFRAGLLQLATTYLQLGRTNEALEVLLEYDKIDSQNATVEYYLSVLCFERLDYLQSWHFLKRLETILSARNHYPRSIKEIRSHLKRVCPDPSLQ